MILLQFVDVYLYEKKNDSNPVKWEEIEVLFDYNTNPDTASQFELSINIEEEFERIVSFEGELIRLKTITLDDDEIPTSYLCYDIENWEFSGKSLIVTNPNEDVHKYALPFK